mmetsp:Transcript_4903/g.14384  ORF Transcript_4903/g.14384 Transcript_4903/m.14384 type:complete len:207 (-) Transcript_4903:386-1006(-)
MVSSTKAHRECSAALVMLLSSPMSEPSPTSTCSASLSSRAARSTLPSLTRPFTSQVSRVMASASACAAVCSLSSSESDSELSPSSVSVASSSASPSLPLLDGSLSSCSMSTAVKNALPCPSSATAPPSFPSVTRVVAFLFSAPPAAPSGSSPLVGSRGPSLSSSSLSSSSISSSSCRFSASSSSAAATSERPICSAMAATVASAPM